MQSKQVFLRRVQKLATWKRRGERARHKPLLLLLALGHLSRGQRQLSFADCRPLLTALLREFGPTRKAYHPEYPFWWLQSDGLWKVTADGPLVRRASNTNPTARALLSTNAVGCFPPDVEKTLIHDATLIQRAAEIILTEHFPQSIHADIRNAIGLVPEDAAATTGARRSSGFRREVLLAYRFSCAVCGFSLRLNDATIGIDAAHIKWRQAKGPDIASNGLALCSIHHKLFDLGAFTLNPQRQVLVSERVTGGLHFDKLLYAYHGASIALPNRQEDEPRPHFMAWHRQQVFKESPLPIARS